MDIVGSTKYFTDEQRAMVESLQGKVRATSEYQKATAKNELISLPTGDGMALVFLSEVEAPLRCAIELAGLLKADTAFMLRMGIHSGLVYIVEDINGQRNASGAGINRAQRVMDCGDENHILLSDAAADVLRQLRQWSGGLHDIGECKVKDGYYHVWSYYDGQVGSAVLPRKSKRLSQRRRMLGTAAGAAIVALSAVAAFVEFRPKGIPASPQTIQPVAVAKSTYAVKEQSLTYSVAVKPPNGTEHIYAKEMLFPAHYGVKFRFQAAQPGFLYLITEGPPTAHGRDWHWLFPYPGYRDGSGALEAGETVSAPAQPDQYYEMDEKSGKELIFVIWSDRQLPELETMKTAVFNGNTHQGALTRDQAETADAFLKNHASEVQAIPGDSSTTLRAQGSILIRSIALEHL